MPSDWRADDGEEEWSEPGPSAHLLRLSDWGPRLLEWLWYPLIPRRKVTLLVGHQEIGKTFFTLDLAARLSRGDRIPPDGALGGPAETLILSGDDELDDTIYPRLDAMGACFERIYALTAGGPKTVAEDRPQISLADGIESLDNAARSMENCRLIVIDPISAFLDGMPANSHAQVRRLLRRLTLLAKARNAAVLLVTHHRKDDAGGVLHRTLGSLAFTLASRVVLTLVNDPATSGRKLLLPAKMNLLPIAKCPGRAFAIEDGEVVWETDPVDTRPDELQRLIARGIATSERLIDIVDELRRLLAQGPLPSLEVHQWANRRHIPRLLLFQAKSMAGIEAHRDGKAQSWCWKLQNSPNQPKRLPDP